MKSEQKRLSVRIVRWGMIAYSCFSVFLLLYVFYNSLRTKGDVTSNTFGAPKSLSLDNYVKLIVDDGFFRYMLNSIVILVCALLLSIFLSSTVAYALGKYKFRLKKFFSVYFLIGLMFPIQLGIVPIFLMIKDLHLIDTHLAVILICGSNISMSVFLLTDFFANLPHEIYEAAIIDGAGEYTAFLKIMFPMASPIVYSMSILSAVQIWNQFFVPLIFLQSEKYKTIPLLVTKYIANLLRTIDSALAVSILSTVPILIVFIIFSNRILDGIAQGGVKG